MTMDLAHSLIRQRSVTANSLLVALHEIHGTLLQLALKELLPEDTAPPIAS
jgi:hypothetical protein